MYDWVSFPNGQTKYKWHFWWNIIWLSKGKLCKNTVGLWCCAGAAGCRDATHTPCSRIQCVPGVRIISSGPLSKGTECSMLTSFSSFMWTFTLAQWWKLNKATKISANPSFVKKCSSFVSNQRELLPLPSANRRNQPARVSSLAICTTEMYLYVYEEIVVFQYIFAGAFSSAWHFSHYCT